MKTAPLVTMLNQIADNFAPYPREEAVAAIADHVTKFWEKRMRAALAAHLADGSDGLSELARAAAARVAAPHG